MTTPARKSPGANRIPTEVQAPYQHRLKVLRTGRGLTLKEIRTLTPATLNRIETEDMSTLRMGDLASLATEYGMTLSEMFTVLASAPDETADSQRSDEERRIQRISVFMRTLPVPLQEMVVDIVHRVMTHNTDQRTVAEVETKPVVVADARSIVRTRLREAREAEQAAQAARSQ